jgi:hypothetical protein
VRNRRKTNPSLYARAASAGGSLAFGAWSKATSRPIDTFAIAAAIAASLIIIVNALFLQSGAHPTPFFATPKSAQVTGNIVLKPTDSVVPAHPAVASAAPQIVTPQPVAVRHNDPIAELITPSSRVAAVQRALSDYGYGQIKSSGVLDDATSTAIEKFEREHRLPVTGRVSDRLVNELAKLAGHPIN